MRNGYEKVMIVVFTVLLVGVLGMGALFFFFMDANLAP